MPSLFLLLFVFLVTGAQAQFARLTGNHSPAAPDLGRVADNLPQEHILLLLKRSAEQQQALQQFMQQQYDPRSANFHKWLTPAEYGALYGPSQDEISRVTRWLTTSGFTVNRVAAGRTFIDFTGTAGQLATALHTEMHHYQRGGETHVANASDPMIPAALAQVVSGFRALNDFHPKAMSKRSRPGSHFTSDFGNGTDYLVSPQDLARIYSVDQVWQQSLVGTGQTIGVIGDTDLASADIKSFRDQFGITSLGPNGSVVIDHPPTTVCNAPDPNSPDLEGYVDAEWTGATAPDATIDFVTCADNSVTAGTDLAATYIVEDAAHAKQDSVLSSSYGYCEQDLGSQANQFYVELWQQAAAEGITVVVAAGDAGGAECDESRTLTYVTHGLSVSGEASTPYNIAVGGTDFSDVFSGTTAQYWSATNGSFLQSVQSYVPETVWNESCANPLVLSWFNQQNKTNFGSSGGSGGLCAYASTLPYDGYGLSPTFNRAAGSGGLSTVSLRPAWQSGVTGLPDGNARTLPDISMFASSGLNWGHSLIFCYSGTDQGCDYTDPNTVFENNDGGTSFVAPAFSGIMALINQKTRDRQGQANNILYALAAQQYVTSQSTSQPNLTTCAASLGTQVLPSCFFHDVTSGTTSVPCTGTATATGTFTDTSTDPASNWENCVGYQITVTGSTTNPDYYGVLSSAGNSSAPAYPATPGYDLATGLGSPNVYALVNAPQWSGLSITTTSLPAGQAGVDYSATLSATGRISPYNWTVLSGSLPAGLTLSPDGTISGTPSTAGVFSFTVQAADAETPAVTATAPYSVTISPAVPPGFTASVNPMSLTILSGNPGTVTITVAGQGKFTGPVNFACGTLPAYFTCRFQANSLALDPSGASAANTLTLYTETPIPAAAGLMFLGMLVVDGKRRRRWMIAGVMAFGFAAGCGGNSDHRAPNGLYTVPVTLSAPGMPSQSFNVSVTVR